MVWYRPVGRISYYIVTVYDKNGNELVEETTNEQFIEIPQDISGYLEVQVNGDCVRVYTSSLILSIMNVIDSVANMHNIILISSQICTVLDDVPGNCTTFELFKEGGYSS